MSKNGFSLIECMIYCVILGLLSVMAFQFFISHARNFVHLQDSGRQLMALYGAHDLLVRDIQAAHASISRWDTQNKTCMRFETQQGDCEWALVQGNLYRHSGKSHALIAQKIAAFHYSLQVDDAQVKAVMIELDMVGLSEGARSTVWLLNRILT